MSTIDQSIFRAYDIRGIVGEALTEEVVEQIGLAVGSESQARGVDTIVVGRDGRLSGPLLQQALMSGLKNSGMEVIDVGMVPTPVIYFAAVHLNAGSCVAVTGSHNPPNYNGLKIVAAGETLSADAIQDLYRRVVEEDWVSGDGSIRSVEIIPDYIERITGDIKPERPLNLIVDCGNGVAGNSAPDLLRKLGCEVTELYCDVDGNFPNHHPDPSKPENVAELRQRVLADGADLGLAFDGDGDRLGVIDSAGNLIFPDRQMMLYAQDILSRKPGGEIIYDVKCTRNLPEIIKQAGGQPTMWKTGHSFIKQKLKATEGALLAGEMSGHIFFKERWYGFDDALYTAARLLEIVAKENRPTAEIFGELPDTINTPELNVQFAEGAHYAFMEQLKKQAQFGGAEVTLIDGIRADYPHGWGLVRPSNTTPVLVFRFEAESQEALEQVQDAFRKEVLNVQSDLSLPF
ncbi:MAG: phosphomannomutase/phosphoglucomutase [Gammaproteobacteria bacterium]|jgi:phosphomannomutase/phosphoglucomutase|nr:phosphomannomutase/phosphoglucomutase [Gammaproteobacteria bacterium]MBT3490320.1 phosphomannomutase/phosphoglucomutase [Gammaproteobacteria bacterium]MBT3717426.1 phosphomannomutase/phosphoglucomutase [Gammaproteobacteria bacterium]MBT3844205.1 phosphomannomutase/phosphoglucomutase [Gammaproteobacteria bacterium]MBT3894166.1 phosphomannomutase/phosphoglucomutase [Gammaproteobacteria bacterium]